MKNFPSALRGVIVAPIIICFLVLVKTFCPESVVNGCYSDQFAVPIFLPLVIVYRVFGSSSVIGGYEFIFVLVYWASVGLLVGLLIDLWRQGNDLLPR